MTALLTLILLASPKPVPIDIQADRMEMVQKSGQIQFIGAVTVTQGALSLRCERLSAVYAKGEVVSLVAEGKVVVHKDAIKATAKRAAYTQKTGQLTLTGQPTVTRGADRLVGTKVLFWPKTGRLVVEKPRGRITNPTLAP